MKRKNIILIFVIIFLLCLAFLLVFSKKETLKETTEVDDTIDIDNGDQKINWEELSSEILDLSNQSVTITEGGTYTLSGTIQNGSVTVNTTEDVKLILNNVEIVNETGPCILIESSKNTVIELAEGSINKLTDGSSYTNAEYDGCIYSKDDLVLEGSGTLYVTSNYQDAIVSKDDLKIIEGTYYIDATDDGIRGKDSVYILDGNLSIKAGTDGIKATNDTDTEKGYVYITNGTIEITSGEDGIQAETKLIIEGGTLSITTNGGSSAASSAIDKTLGNSSSYDTTSSKGLKSGNNLIVKGGSITINSKDDAIHSNAYIAISAGTMNISSGDDGIHADTEIIIDGGEINITKSYEGIESKDITINGGDIALISSDDGINVSGGVDSSSVQNRPGSNQTSTSGGVLTINGGTIIVDATGDGLDANGSIKMTGGTVSILGPTSSGNGVLDYDSTFTITGGVLIASGSSGMAQTPSSSSTQNSIAFYLTQSKTGDFQLVNEDNQVIATGSSSKNFQFVVFSSSKIKIGEKYTLKVEGTEITTITATQTVTSNSSNVNQGGMGSRR